MLENWHDDYDGNLRIILPDTYGTKGFLERAPDWLASWTGIRIDSGVPEEGAETAIAWWESRGQNPREKLVIFSDGLDVDRIEALYARFHGRVKLSFGWGTLLTNDFRGLAPDDALAPFSLVCKAVSAERPPDGQALRQPRQGARAGRPGRALQAGLRRRRADRRAGAGLRARAGRRLTASGDAPRRSRAPAACWYWGGAGVNQLTVIASTTTGIRRKQ